MSAASCKCEPMFGITNQLQSIASIRKFFESQVLCHKNKHLLCFMISKATYPATPAALELVFLLGRFRDELSFSFVLCLDSRLLFDLLRVRAAFNSAVSTRDPAEPTLHRDQYHLFYTSGNIW